MSEFCPSPNISKIESWPLAKIASEIAPRLAPEKTNCADHFFYATRATIVHEFLLLGKVRCAICNGWGHSHKICPTNSKLKHFSKAQMSRTILKRCKERAKENNSYIAKGLGQHHSSLPATKVLKRNRTEFDAATQGVRGTSLVQQKKRSSNLLDKEE